MAGAAWIPGHRGQPRQPPLQARSVGRQAIRRTPRPPPAMNLTIAEIRELPIAAALLDQDDDVIATTPEWDGAGPGTVLFGLRQSRLAVTVVPADHAAAAILDGLLAALEATGAALKGGQRMRVSM